MEASPLIFGFVAGFALFVLVGMTAYLKLSVVFMMVRQALGIQQVPSNMIIMTLTIFLAAFISKPVIIASFTAMVDLGVTLESAENLIAIIQQGLAPFQEFIGANTDQEHLLFLREITDELWRETGVRATTDDIVIQIPAFMITELTEAFEIGFLLYLPFVAIDVAVTGILMALGMQMVQPNIIAAPFKLLLFVSIDGWGRLVQGLLLSYSV